MKVGSWCEHLDKHSKYVVVRYRFEEKEVLLRIQTWYCPECGVYGSDTELMPSTRQTTAAATESSPTAAIFRLA